MDRARFSISLLCEQISKTCRLCGVDNPDKIPILGAEDIIASDEPPLAKKIELCIGIKVTLTDKMPQLICSLCVDKMNDFYEYRMMCETTDLEIRKILHLPMVQPATSLPKAEPVDSAVITLDDEDVDEKPKVKRGPKTRNRKKQLEADDAPGNSEEADVKPALDEPSEKRSKYDFPCEYCNESFIQSSELERHRVVKHTPLVHKFGCGSCMEYFDTATEYKDHNLWHKLTRTAFGCFRCGKKFAYINTLNKHVSLNACIRMSQVSYEVALVPDMQCRLCQKTFKTRNLYEWHGCFIRARSSCPKCGRNFLKKNLLMRHFILYCNGTLPLLDPIIVPKDEPDAASVNGQPSSGGTEVRRRGRPSRASMKNETIDLPLPPLFDLPDLKSESNSIPDGHNSTGGIFSGTEAEDNQKRTSLIEETNKIATLLRSGESVDGNTDLNTISSMLSSVNEAIATISKVRKKKKKRDRLSSSGAGNASENPPMVVLSKANVKQELHEDSGMLATLVANNAVLENGLNETIPTNEDHREVEDAESEQDVDDYDNAADSFAHHNDDGGDSDSDVEIISVEQYQPIGSGTNFTSNWNDVMRPNDESAQPVELQIKQELMASNDGDESDFEGYEDASMFVAVKQEPMEETVATSPIVQCSVVDKHSEASFSSYQALRIKIKKEKGLLNASVVGEEPATTDPISTPEECTEEQTDNGQSRGAGNTKKAAKTTTQRNSKSPPVKRYMCTSGSSTSTSGLNVSIKQEPMEAENEQSQESVTDPEQDYPAEATFIDTTTVRIKQEPQEGNSPGSPAEDVITFDGKRIKRERLDDYPASHNPRQASSNDSYKKSLNPLSLSGVRIAAGKKSADSQSGVTVNKSSVMINPFALLKQKESVSTVSEQDSTSKDSTDSLAEQSERFGLPVISQVKSIDPVEHLSLTSDDNVAAEPTPVVEQQQKETTVEMIRNDSTENLRHTDSPPMSEPSVSKPVAVAFPQKNVAELKIKSVTTVPEDIVPLPQENDGELRTSSVTTIPEDLVPPQENVNDLKTSSVTTIPEDLVPPQANVNELKITSVTTIPKDLVPLQETVSELKISSVTTIPKDLVPPQETVSELKISSVTTIPEEQNFHSEDPYNEQQLSAGDAHNSDVNAIPEGVPERDDSDDLIPRQVTKDAETSSGSDVKDRVETVDSCQDDGRCKVDEHDDDDDDDIEKEEEAEEEKEKEKQKTPHNEENEREEISATATIAEHEQLQPNNHDTVVAEPTGTIDTTAETDGEDVNVNPATCSERQQELLCDESSREEVQPGTQKEFGAIASNDEGLVAKQ
ncbi:uncharacterized protein LOC128305564 [Anopheles moucheti]|uniref:uncharacterized protein LOC128305564 n=1 Tax=Anopheles moucheti TaxID=186751 RepID=UPI0022F0ADD2|nr:uncharacterized protein LOC128305564 [Anopheles moucheti]